MTTTTDTSALNEMTETERTAMIAHLNDQTRKGQHRSSKIVLTSSLHHMLRGEYKTEGQAMANLILGQQELLKAINTTPIDAGDNPHSENDFGALDFKGEWILWKIDYYADDGTFQWGSDAPWDASKTFRILTIMLASDY